MVQYRLPMQLLFSLILCFIIVSTTTNARSLPQHSRYITRTINRRQQFAHHSRIFTDSNFGASQIDRLIHLRTNALSIAGSEDDLQDSIKDDSEPEQSPSEPEVKAKGYTLDPCFYHRNCKGTRLCIRSDWRSSCSGSANCICMAQNIQFCDKCKECLNYPNESCIVAKSDIADGLCVSTFTVWEGITKETTCNSYPNVSPAPEEATSPIPHISGYENNGTTNYQEEESAAPKSANPLPSNQPTSSPSLSPSPILPSYGSIPSSTPTMAPSSSVSTADDDSSNNQNGSTSAECIDAKALRHLSVNDKVYKQDRRASVLCDQLGSCATPGHMVLVKVNGKHERTEKAMTMNSYCRQHAENGCSKRVINVNSPRFRQGLRLPSKSSNLLFTAFSASYLTSIEEYTLSTLIHMGL